MKSSPSFFNATVLKKNLSRFAPAWGLYTLGALMGLILLLDSGSHWIAKNLVDVVNILCVITPCYALLCAQLLFGDLYNSRMCNALHALPMKRETWFFTNVLSGFVFHLIPTAVLTLLIIPVLAFYCPENSILAAPIFLLGTNLQFACFFSLAVFCAFCVGSRFALAVLYGIVNFGSIIAGWLVDTIFVPMYYGIEINIDPFYLFSPIAHMVNSPFADVQLIYGTSYRNPDDLVGCTFLPDQGTVYYFVVAAMGIALLFGAMQLYRRRKLECAGDFLAIRGLEPVFLVVYSVIVGAVFHFCANAIVGMETYLFLLLGLAVGWFTGKMLLERSARVFRKKNVLHCCILLGGCVLTIVVALMDPLGIESWIPDGSKVTSVTIADGPYRYPQNHVTLQKPEDIARIISIHEATLEDHRNNTQDQNAFDQIYQELITEDYVEIIPEDMDHYCSFTITYRLDSGRQVRRHYSIWLGNEHGEYLKQIFSVPETIFGYEEDLSRFLSENPRISIRDTCDGNEIVIRSQGDIAGLYQAILADCRAGHMAQLWTFHYRHDNLYWIYLADGTEITVFTNCENTLSWLRSYGLDVDDIIEKHGN